MLAAILRSYFCVCFIIYAICFPNDKVDLKGRYEILGRKKLLYIVGDLILCIPLFIVLLWEIWVKYVFKRKQFSFVDAISIFVSAIPSIIGYQRDYLTVLNMNKIFAFARASRNESMSNFYIKEKENQFNLLSIFVAAIVAISMVERALACLIYLYYFIFCNGYSAVTKVYHHRYQLRRKIAVEEKKLWREAEQIHESMN